MISSRTDHVDVCRSAYSSTQACYDGVKAELGGNAMGFRILYTPPQLDARYLFLGFQPGGRGDHAKEKEHQIWPEHSSYFTERYPLAVRIRSVFGISDRDHVGLNVIFFRSPSIRTWNGVPKALRQRLERFSMEQARIIVKTLAPRNVIVIGLGTFKRLVKVGEAELDGNVLPGSKGKQLAIGGHLWGLKATAVVHLSGARVSTGDLATLRRYFQAAPTPEANDSVTRG